MLDMACVNFLEDRGLDVEVATKYGLYTANIKGIQGKSVLAIPYYEDGRLINEKFRMLPKEKFWQHAGRRKLFWNVDALKDPLLEGGHTSLIITEGELDALAAIQCGFPLSVSVPDGAPPAGPHDTEHSGSDDQDGRFSFMFDVRDRLKRIQRFVLAVDNDGPGQRLQAELITRLGAGRCKFVEYPPDCKDLNDILNKHGAKALVEAIDQSKPCPVRGGFYLDDYPDDGPLQVYGTGWPMLDPNFRVVPGSFVVVTGIPQHGKSSFALHLLANLAHQHGWRSAIFSPEMRVSVIRDRLMQIRYRANWDMLAAPEHKAWLRDNFLIIGTDPTPQAEDDDFDLDFILNTAADLVMRDGIKVLLIDPWNEVEHARHKNETMTEYVSRGIRACKRFARKYDVTVIVVAHPTKMELDRKTKTFVRPTLYDISDSAAWFNKCDHGLVIYRDFAAGTTEVAVMKSRFDEAGEPGMVRMKFNPHTHRFEALDGSTEGGIDP